MPRFLGGSSTDTWLMIIVSVITFRQKPERTTGQGLAYSEINLRHSCVSGHMRFEVNSMKHMRIIL
ncbi:hypothetical protein QTP88_008656 [Uroleucon formosanum]